MTLPVWYSFFMVLLPVMFTSIFGYGPGSGKSWKVLKHSDWVGSGIEYDPGQKFRIRIGASFFGCPAKIRIPVFIIPIPVQNLNI
jgi:hypothetical protein